MENIRNEAIREELIVESIIENIERQRGKINREEMWKNMERQNCRKSEEKGYTMG